LATTVLVSGGLGLSGLGAGTAQAACTPDTGGYSCGYGPNHWCPGDSVYSDQGGPDNGVNWDMSVCHTWYRVAQGAGNVPVPERPGSNENSSTVWEDPIRRLLRFLRLRLSLGYLRLPVCAGPCGFRGPARVARSIVGPRPRK